MTREQSGHDLLGIYLNDHLAGATGGTLLARRMAASGRYQSDDGTLWRLAEDIARDRATLLDLLAALSIPVRGYKASRHGPPSGSPGSSPTVTWLPGRRCPTWRSWKCCGWALKARLPGGGPCGNWRTATADSTRNGWKNSCPAPASRRTCSKNSACAPPSGSSACGAHRLCGQRQRGPHRRGFSGHRHLLLGHDDVRPGVHQMRIDQLLRDNQPHLITVPP